MLEKHWHILHEDPILSKYVSDHPEIVFKMSLLMDILLMNMESTNVGVASSVLGSLQAKDLNYTMGNSYIHIFGLIVVPRG